MDKKNKNTAVEWKKDEHEEVTREKKEEDQIQDVLLLENRQLERRMCSKHDEKRNGLMEGGTHSLVRTPEYLLGKPP